MKRKRPVMQSVSFALIQPCLTLPEQRLMMYKTQCKFQFLSSRSCLLNLDPKNMLTLYQIKNKFKHTYLIKCVFIYLSVFIYSFSLLSHHFSIIFLTLLKMTNYNFSCLEIYLLSQSTERHACTKAQIF